MQLSEPFNINNKSYTRQELIDYSFTLLDSGKLEEWEQDIYRFFLAFLDEEVALQQMTSGTTGDPKTIELTRDAMLLSAKKTIDYFDLQPGQNILLCLPVKYIAGKMIVVRALLGGLNILTVEPTSNPLKRTNAHVHFTAMVPLQVFQTLENKDLIDSVDKLIIGGGEISQTLLDKIKKLSHSEVYETFAMSETCSHFAVRRINGKVPETLFTTFDGVQIATDKRACLRVDINGITEGPIQSNDLVELHSNNTFKWLGRIDNVINSGGKKIIPEILEAKIRSIINYELLVIGLPDQKLGQRHVLAVESWKESLIQKLSRHEVPKEIHCIGKFPRNKSMKVERMRVRGLIIN